MLSSREKINYKILFFYFPAMMILYLVSVFFQNVSVPTISGILMVMSLLLMMKTKIQIKKESIAITLYFLIMVLSILQYIFFNGMPSSFYYTGVVYSALPIVMFWIPKGDRYKLLRTTFISIELSIVVAFVLFQLKIPEYADYLVFHGYLRNALHISTSFQGLYGITAVGTYSACCTIFFYGCWLEKSKLLDLVCSAFSVFILIFTLRRSAVAGCAVAFTLLNVIFFKKFKKMGKRQVIIGFVFILIIAGFWVVQSSKFFSVITRVLNISEAVSERSGNWDSNYSLIMSAPIFGTGVGSAGHNAFANGYMSICDNSYLLMLRESGFAGLLCFFACILSVYKIFLQNRNKDYIHYICFSITIIYIIQGIGSNVWEFPISAALFWMVLSLCCGNDTIDGFETATIKEGDYIAK